MDVTGQYILSVDQSTSGTKALIIDNKGRILEKNIIEHKQYYPNPGWVEHDPEELFQNTLRVIKLTLDRANINPGELACLSITNQRETIVVWDKNTGKPVYNAVVWQCQRGREFCKYLKDAGYEEMIKEKTGLIVDPYFSATGIKWILDNVKGAREQAEKGQLIFGTIDSWLVWKLTEGRVHACDYSNASRTMLYNIRKLEWDQEIMALLDIPSSMTPDVKYSDGIFGESNLNYLLKKKIPITGVAGDSHAALFAQKCFQRGMAKATYGTGSSIAMNIGGDCLNSDRGLVTSIGWGVRDHINYIYEGNVHATGATVKWLVEKMDLIPNSAASEELARQVEDNGGVYFIPAFVGLGAPYWNNKVKAAITGITFETGKPHLVRAALESIVYQIKDVVDLMVSEAEIEMKELRVDGGPTKNQFLMQFQADMLGVPVIKVEFEELSAMGVAYMGGLTAGIWDDLEALKDLHRESREYKSRLSNDRRNLYYNGWKEAVNNLIN